MKLEREDIQITIDIINNDIELDIPYTMLSIVQESEKNCAYWYIPEVGIMFGDIDSMPEDAVILCEVEKFDDRWTTTNPLTNAIKLQNYVVNSLRAYLSQMA